MRWMIIKQNRIKRTKEPLINMLDNKIITSDKKLLPYIQKLLDRDHAYRRGDLVDDETYLNIVHEWIDWFEKNINQTIENTFKIYDSLNADCGYDSIASRWGFKNRITKEQIEEQYRGNFTACIAHLYQAIKSKRDLYSSGATGLNIYCRFSLDFIDSDLKSVKKIAISDITMGLDIPTSRHSEIDVR